MISNIIKKANLSADKQAVRSMNQALADWDAANGYAAVPDVETCMQILANAGYNTDNWVCLADGYQVYWYQNDNLMILYNATIAEIEYPDEYVGTKTMITSENGFFIYNENHVKAQQFDMSITSHVTDSSTLSKGTSISSATSYTTQATNLNSNETANITKIETAITSTNSAVKTALLNGSSNKGSSTELYYYATREVVSADTGNAYASLQIAAVGTEKNPVELVNNGKLSENLYYLTIVKDGSYTEAELQAAKTAAGEYLYNIFDQITTGKINSDAVIIIEGGTELDCSTCEWAPCKTFTGYFGTTDASNPVIINGARLTTATGHSQTVAFNGSSSKYFVTGFFGTIYGDTTIENVTFKNITITNPASDYELTASDKGSKLINTRNTVGIIGGITDAYSSSQNGVEANVTLRNIVVESSCSITGSGCAGGLVGYIGSANSDASSSNGTNLKGKITIENCEVHANVTSTDSSSSAGYKSVGGIVGFSCRVGNDTNITIKNCTVDSKLTGYGNTGAVAGAFQKYPTVVIDGGSYSSATVSGSDHSAAVVGYIDGADTPITKINSPALNTSLADTYIGGSGKEGYTINASGKPTKN